MHLAGKLRTRIDLLPDPETSAPAIGGRLRSSNWSAAACDATDYTCVQQALEVVAADFHRQFARRFPKYSAASGLAIGLQPCILPSCSLVEFYRRPANSTFDRFAKVYGWMKHKGIAAVDRAYAIGPHDAIQRIKVRLDKGYEWMTDLPTPTLQEALGRAVRAARRHHSTISYAAASLAGLSQQSAAHLGDVFDAPYAALSGLPSRPGDFLPGVSDEVARMRIKDCVRFRGQFSPEKVGSCAGYVLTQDQLAKCMTGGHCAPPYGNLVTLEALSIGGQSEIRALAQNATLPRIDLNRLPHWAKSVESCVGARGPGADACLLREGVATDRNASRTLACLHKAHIEDEHAVVDCATTRLPKQVQLQVACVNHYRGNYRAMALCASKGSLPKTAQVFMACEVGGMTGRAVTEKCLAQAALGPQAACLSRLHRGGDWTGVALCLSGSASPQVRGAVKCAEKAHSVSSLGVCMVANEGSGEARRVAACYAEGQGVPSVVAVCLASDHLTQDQRVVLECAAETNGALPATAECAVGKEFLKEMTNCEGGQFAKGKCFGRNNEIRKFCRKFLHTDIGQNSAVAQVLNIPLRLSNATTVPVIKVGINTTDSLAKMAAHDKLYADPNHPLTFLVPAGTWNAEKAVVQSIGRGAAQVANGAVHLGNQAAELHNQIVHRLPEPMKEGVNRMEKCAKKPMSCWKALSSKLPHIKW